MDENIDIFHICVSQTVYNFSQHIAYNSFFFIVYSSKQIDPIF